MRRLHEVEFIVHKFQQSMTLVDETQNQIKEINDRYAILDLEMKTKMNFLNDTVEKTFPDMIQDYSAEVRSSIMKVNAIEHQIHTIFQHTTKQHENTVKNFKETIHELQKRIETIENRGQQKSDAYEAIQITVDEINQVVAQLHSSQETGFNQKQIEFQAITQKLNELQKQLEDSERRKIEKYFTQVAHVDMMVRKLEDKMKLNEENVDLISKHFLIDNQITQYNATFETLSRILKAEELSKLCDYMQEKQDEMVKKKNNISALSRKDSKIAAHKQLQRPVPFTRIPKKPKAIERMATMNELKTFFDSSLANILETMPQLSMNQTKSNNLPLLGNTIEINKQMLSEVNRESSRNKEQNKSRETTVSHYSKHSKHSHRSKTSVQKNQNRNKIDKGKLEVLQEVVEATSPDQTKDNLVTQNISEMNRPKSDLKRQYNRRLNTQDLDLVKKTTTTQKAIQPFTEFNNVTTLRTIEENETPKDQQKKLETKGKSPKDLQKILDSKVKSPTAHSKRLETKVISPKDYQQKKKEITSKTPKENQKEAEVKETQIKNQKLSPIQTNQGVNLGEQNQALVEQTKDLLFKDSEKVQAGTDEVQTQLLKVSKPMLSVEEQDSMTEQSPNVETKFKRQSSKISESPGLRNRKQSKSQNKISLQEPQKIQYGNKQKKPLSQSSENSDSRFTDEDFSESNSRIKKRKRKDTSESNSVSNSGSGSRSKSYSQSQDQSQSSAAMSQNKIKELINEKLKKLEKKLKNEIKETKETIYINSSQHREAEDQIEDSIKQLTQKVEQNKLKENKNFKEIRFSIDEHRVRLEIFTDRFTNLLEEEKQIFSDKVETLYKDFICKVDGELTRRNRLRNDIFVKFQDLEDRFKTNENSQFTIDKKISKLFQTLKKMAIIQQIQSAINIQDEKDREWVSLFGVTEAQPSASHTQPKSSLVKETVEKGHFTVNQECISCTGNNLHQLRLFKAACLNYKANPVLHDGKMFDRREILTIQSLMTQKTRDQLEERKFEIDNEINQLATFKETERFEFSDKVVSNVASKEQVGDRPQSRRSGGLDSILKQIHFQDDELKELDSPNGTNNLKQKLFGDTLLSRRDREKLRPRSIAQTSNNQSTIMSSIVIEHKSTAFPERFIPAISSISRQQLNQNLGGLNPITSVEIGGVGGFNSHVSQIIQGSNDFDSIIVGNQSLPFEKREFLVKKSVNSKQQLQYSLKQQKDTSKVAFQTQGANLIGTIDTVNLYQQRPQSVAGLTSTFQRQNPSIIGSIQEKNRSQPKVQKDKFPQKL